MRRTSIALEISGWSVATELRHFLAFTIETAAEGCVETRRPQASVETLKLGSVAAVATKVAQ